MRKLTIISGPAEVANIFGYWGHLLPAGKFAVVKHGELTNGGFGPICQSVHRTREAAEKKRAEINAAIGTAQTET